MFPRKSKGLLTRYSGIKRFGLISLPAKMMLFKVNERIFPRRETVLGLLSDFKEAQDTVEL